MTNVSAGDLERLAAWDTPTICNALEIVAPDRRGSGYTVRPMVCADPDLKPIVGWARTATIRTSEPPSTSVSEQQKLRVGYYEYVAAGVKPTIAVIEDLDSEPGYGAFWGEVNTAIHKGLGALGVVTNGSIRDMDACAPGFQLLAGMVGPSHAYAHVVETGCPVNVFGMGVEHDSIIHADRHGAVVIPASAVAELPAAVDLLIRREAVILERARAADFNIDQLRQAMTDARDIH